MSLKNARSRKADEDPKPTPKRPEAGLGVVEGEEAVEALEAAPEVHEAEVEAADEAEAVADEVAAEDEAVADEETEAEAEDAARSEAEARRRTRSRAPRPIRLSPRPVWVRSRVKKRASAWRRRPRFMKRR